MSPEAQLLFDMIIMDMVAEKKARQLAAQDAMDAIRMAKNWPSEKLRHVSVAQEELFAAVFWDEAADFIESRKEEYEAELAKSPKAKSLKAKPIKGRKK